MRAGGTSLMIGASCLTTSYRAARGLSSLQPGLFHDAWHRDFPVARQDSLLPLGTRRPRLIKTLPSGAPSGMEGLISLLVDGKSLPWCDQPVLAMGHPLRAIAASLIGAANTNRIRRRRGYGGQVRPAHRSLRACSPMGATEGIVPQPSQQPLWFGVAFLHPRPGQ